MNTSSNLKAYSPFLPIEREEPQTPILLSDLLFLYLELKGKFRRFKEKVKKQEECHQRAHGNETRLLNDIKCLKKEIKENLEPEIQEKIEFIKSIQKQMEELNALKIENEEDSNETIKELEEEIKKVYEQSGSKIRKIEELEKELRVQKDRNSCLIIDHKDVLNGNNQRWTTEIDDWRKACKNKDNAVLELQTTVARQQGIIKDWEENSRLFYDEIADLRHELEVANTGFLSSTPEVKERDEIIKEKIQIIEDQKKMIERDTKTIEFHRNRLQWITLAISKVNTGLWYWDEGSGYTRIYSKDGKDILNSV